MFGKGKKLELGHPYVRSVKRTNSSYPATLTIPPPQDASLESIAFSPGGSFCPGLDTAVALPWVNRYSVDTTTSPCLVGREESWVGLATPTVSLVALSFVLGRNLPVSGVVPFVITLGALPVKESFAG